MDFSQNSDEKDCMNSFENLENKNFEYVSMKFNENENNVIDNNVIKNFQNKTNLSEEAPNELSLITNKHEINSELFSSSMNNFVSSSCSHPNNFACDAEHIKRKNIQKCKAENGSNDFDKKEAYFPMCSNKYEKSNENYLLTEMNYNDRKKADFKRVHLNKNFKKDETHIHSSKNQTNIVNFFDKFEAEEEEEKDCEDDNNVKQNKQSVEESNDNLVRYKTDEKNESYTNHFSRESTYFYKNTLNYLSSFFISSDEKSLTASSTLQYLEEEKKESKDKKFKEKLGSVSTESSKSLKNNKNTSTRNSLKNEFSSLKDSLDKICISDLSDNDNLSFNKENNVNKYTNLSNASIKTKKEENNLQGEQEVISNENSKFENKEYNHVPRTKFQSKKSTHNCSTDNLNNTSSLSSITQIDDILLVVHGIGSSDKSIYSHRDELRQSIKFIKEHWFWNVDINTHIELINWKKIILDVQNHIFDQITLTTMSDTRKIINLSAADLMCFLTPRYGDLIVYHVAQEINQVIHKLKMDPSNRFKNSKISLIGYSLGSVICYELISGKPIRFSHFDISEHQSNFPKIKYPIENFFILGSSLSAFLLLHTPELLYGGFFLPENLNFYNIFHSHDPLAFRIEKLIYPDRDKLPKAVLLPYWRNNGVRYWYEWDRNMQAAKNVIVQNLNDFASSISKTIFGWWEGNKQFSSLDRNLVQDPKAKSQKDLIKYKSRLRESGKKKKKNIDNFQNNAFNAEEKNTKIQNTKGKKEEKNNFLKSYFPFILSSTQEKETFGDKEDLEKTNLDDQNVINLRNGTKKEIDRNRLIERVISDKEKQDSANISLPKNISDAELLLSMSSVNDYNNNNNKNTYNLLNSHDKSSLPTTQSPISLSQPNVFEKYQLFAEKDRSNTMSSQMLNEDTNEGLEEIKDEDDNKKTDYNEKFSSAEQLKKLNEYSDPQLPCRYDFQLQEDTTEHYLSSLAILQSHFNYWRFKDVAFFILKCLTKHEPTLSYPDYLKKVEAETRMAAEKIKQANELEGIKLEKVADERLREAKIAMRKELTEAAADDLKILSTENNPFLRKNDSSNSLVQTSSDIYKPEDIYKDFTIAATNKTSSSKLNASNISSNVKNKENTDNIAPFSNRRLLTMHIKKKSA